LVSSWITCSGVPQTITSDRGPQLCKMLHITNRQTTAYHTESNGAVKRHHRHLKDAQRSHTAGATWAEEIPGTGLSPAEAVFGAPIVFNSMIRQARGQLKKFFC
jgi:hypothetical protein